MARRRRPDLWRSEHAVAPEDLAEVIVFLGFGASMVTGQTIVVDGGLTL